MDSPVLKLPRYPRTTPVAHTGRSNGSIGQSSEIPRVEPLAITYCFPVVLTRTEILLPAVCNAMETGGDIGLDSGIRSPEDN